MIGRQLDAKCNSAHYKRNDEGDDLANQCCGRNGQSEVDQTDLRGCEKMKVGGEWRSRNQEKSECTKYYLRKTQDSEEFVGDCSKVFGTDIIRFGHDGTPIRQAPPERAVLHSRLRTQQSSPGVYPTAPLL